MRGFPVDEFQDRLTNSQLLMADTGLNTLFIASEAVALPLSLLARHNLWAN